MGRKRGWSGGRRRDWKKRWEVRKVLEVEESARGGIGGELEPQGRNREGEEGNSWEKETNREVKVEESARRGIGPKLEQEGNVKVEQPPVQEKMADSVPESTFLVNTQSTLISYCPLR